MNTYDIIIIGAGHNGLTAAASLAKAGKKVLVLEKRSIVGGACVADGEHPSLAPFTGGSLRPDIVRHLGLDRFGLPPAPVKTDLVSLLPDSRQLILSADTTKTVASIAQFSKTDSAKWADFIRFMDKAASFLDSAYQTPIPRLPNFPLTEGIPLAKLGLKLRGMGAKDMYNTIRLLPMTAREFLDEWFESEELKAAIASLGIHNANLGVMSAGSAYNLLHQYLIRGNNWGQPQYPGGAAQITEALSAAAKAYGAEIRTGADVVHIRISDGKASGVVLASGEEINAPAIISSADPKRTFISLVTPEHLDPEFVWSVQTIKMRGVTAIVGAKHASSLQNGTFIIAPTLNYLERAYDAAKYGEISEKPYLEVTKAGDRLTIHFQFAPYFLRNATWDDATRARLEEITLDTLGEYLPNLKSQIQDLKSATPLDLETNFSLTEGDPHHGQLMLDQFFFMRPVAGWANHKTPIDGLYLCGSGIHGGGGVSGIPGRNAAKAVLTGK